MKLIFENIFNSQKNIDKKSLIVKKYKKVKPSADVIIRFLITASSLITLKSCGLRFVTDYQ